MRLIHVIPTISEEASGPSYSVPRLCESLIAAGADVQLAALYRRSTRAPLPFLKTFSTGFGPPRLGVSPNMRRWLNEEAASGRIDIMHSHSLWMMPNVYPGQACRHGRCRLVVSPRGTLSSWALGRNALQKRIFWRWIQEPALRNAACFHATAESEYEDIRRRGFRQPICILPNGIDLPPLEHTTHDGRRQILFLGRIHPKKGVDVLLRAWQVVAPRFPEWELCIVGPEEGGYLARMQGLAADLRLERIRVPWPDVRRRTSCAPIGRPACSCSPRIPKISAWRWWKPWRRVRPAIVTQGAPWAGLVEQGAGWWIEIGLDSVGRLSRAGAVDFAATSRANGPRRPRMDATRFFVGTHRPPIPCGLSMVVRRRRAA